MCDATLWNDPDGLRCTRTEPHQTGHVYRPGSGYDDERVEDQ